MFLRLHLAHSFTSLRSFVRWLVLAGLGLASLTALAASTLPLPLAAQTPVDIQTGPDDQASRTAAQKKIDSQLLNALKQKRGETKGVPTEPIELELDQKGRTLVDVTADVSPQVESRIRKLGGAIVSSDERYHTIRARLALEKMEALAALKDVRFIAPAAMPMFNRVKPN